MWDPVIIPLKQRSPAGVRLPFKPWLRSRSHPHGGHLPSARTVVLLGLLPAGARQVPVQMSASPALHQARLLSDVWVLEAPGSLP